MTPDRVDTETEQIQRQRKRAEPRHLDRMAETNPRGFGVLGDTHTQSTSGMTVSIRGLCPPV